MNKKIAAMAVILVIAVPFAAAGLGKQEFSKNRPAELPQPHIGWIWNIFNTENIHNGTNKTISEEKRMQNRLEETEKKIEMLERQLALLNFLLG